MEQLDIIEEYLLMNNYLEIELDKRLKNIIINLYIIYTNNKL